MLVNTSAYDFLYAFFNVSIFYGLETYLNGHFDVAKKKATQFE